MLRDLRSETAAFVTRPAVYEYRSRFVSNIMLLKKEILNLCAIIPADSHEVPFSYIQSMLYT
jgi:hypothetical protein